MSIYVYLSSGWRTPSSVLGLQLSSVHTESLGRLSHFTAFNLISALSLTDFSSLVHSSELQTHSPLPSHTSAWESSGPPKVTCPEQDGSMVPHKPTPGPQSPTSYSSNCSDQNFGTTINFLILAHPTYQEILYILASKHPESNRSPPIHG